MSDSPISQFIPIRTHQEVSPLSFAQQRIWFLDQWNPGTAIYNMPIILRMTGPLQLGVLERSLQEILRRHESLRTTFAEEQGQTVQVIATEAVLDMTTIDLSHLPEEERKIETARRITEESKRPFDLVQGPLFRVRLLRSSDREHVLIASMHHIVTDGWSLGVFFHELGLLYEAFLKDEASPLVPLPIQYADYAVWQRQWMQGEVLEQELQYWREQLQGLAVLELPTDRPRPPMQSYRGNRLDFSLSPSLTQALKDLCRQEGVTLFMALLAAFQTQLHRYTRQEDIAVGTPIANRSREELEGLIGFFVNTQVMRTNLGGNPGFRELLGRVREVALGAYAHQNVPFEKLVEELKPERDPGRNPLFQVMMVLQNAADSALKMPGLTIEHSLGDIGTAKFDLMLELEESAEGITGSFEYNTDLFDEATVERMIGHFQTLLEGIVANPDGQIAGLPLLTDAERHQLLVEWNNTKTDYPKEACVHHLFEAQVERTPDAVAIVFEGQELTYRELNARANQLANYLKKRGVGPDVLVGICVERSIEMIVGLLGILKAGGAYVPLDAEYPRERLEFMVRDTGIQILLLQRRMLESFPVAVAELVCLDTDWPKISSESAQNPIGGSKSTNLAYVMYTSGSTGIPKGVEIPHQGIVRLVMNTGYAGFNSNERYLQLATIAFDASTFELWAPLLHGACCVLYPLEIPGSGRLGEVIRQHRISTLWLTASLFNMVINEAPKTLRGLSQLLIGGEQLSPSHVHRAQKELDGTQIINGYGPTESTTFTCCYAIPEGLASDAILPIGRPIANTRVYILDNNLEPLPIGIPGELHIGGDGLARGYLNRQELTSEKFISDPFSAEPNARLYKTGDLVRYRFDGNIEFLGRIDQQVKIRGFRIELGEIEAVLCLHPGIDQAAVVAQEDALKDKRLIAYVVPKTRDAEPISQSELRQFLKQKLPEYMIPSIFVTLDAMKLTSSGKVDRQALPAPDQARPDLEGSYVSPRTPVEEALAEIWAEVLGLEKIGIRDSFFELGGHSLRATQVISHVRRVFGIDLPLRRLFESPTVESLAGHVQAALGASSPASTPDLISIARDRNLPLSFAQQRLWFLDQWNPGTAVYNIPVILHMTGPLHISALERSLQEILRRHESLRTTFAEEQGLAVQRFTAEVVLDMTTIDLSHLPEEERKIETARRITEESKRPFDLVQGPLFRVRLLRSSDREHVLIASMHHIVTDGWSLGIFFHEFGLLYEAFLKDEASPLVPLPIQYADYAVWQRQWMQGEVLEQELKYWREQLHELAVLELPTDRPRPPMQSYQGNRLGFSLSPTLTQALKDLCRREGATLFMALLAAFQTQLHRYTRQEDIAVGTPIANRSREELEGLIGFFVNTQVMRTNLGGNPGFRELLGRVREVALGAYANQNVPFEKLVEELAPERDPGRNPLFQVMMVLQNAADSALKMPGLTIERSSVETGTAMFDLTLELEESAEGIAGSFEYNTDLFDEATVERMIGHFQTLLEGIVANPDGQIAGLSLLTDAERHQLLVEWNNTKTDYPKEACVHHLFEAEVERTPDAVAIVFEGQEFTYRELNARANQLAHYLKKRGVGPDVLVGICVERSIEMIVGLLGILKAGGAYVPLDAEYPRERLEFMVRDTGIQILLLQRRMAESFPVAITELVCLDTDWPKISSESEQNPISGSKSTNLAYVMYTSGSTGIPKGVEIPHQGIVRLVMNTGYAGFNSNERYLHLATIAFDASTFELWGPLLHGACCVLYPVETPSPDRLKEIIRTDRISTLLLTTSLFNMVINEAPQTLQGASQLLIGGEQLSSPHINRAQIELAGIRIINAYGPTESTTITCCYAIPEGLASDAILPIGRPIANTQVYILDNNLEPLPIGIPGELHIGGDGLARGYLNRPELTAEKFIPDPFSTETGARLYKTGDLTRYRVDGNIEFLGRIDNQIKIRGFRIELGEIEAVLCLHPGIGEAAVVAQEDALGDKSLIAYVVPKTKDAEPISQSELRQFLKQRLPEYMVPSIFVTLDAMKLTSSGKVDRRALPAPDRLRSDLEGSFVSPRTPVEEALAEIWADVLGLKKIGIRDSFFELGGHSLRATQVISHLRRVFGIDLPLRRLFESPTVESLAEHVQAALGASSPASTPDLISITRDRNLPLSFAQQRLWFLDQWNPGTAAYNIPIILCMTGPLQLGVLERSLQEILRRHESLRTTFAEEQGQTVQVIATEAVLDMTTIDLSHLPEEERKIETARRITEESKRPFDLVQGPLFRVRLLRSSDREHVLIASMHHIVTDGWSLGVFFHELGLLYEAFLKDEASPLVPLPIQYADYAVWQRQWMQGEVLEQELKYWREQLQGLAVLELPTDRPRPPMQSYQGNRLDFSLSPSLTQALKDLCRQEGVTLFMALLAAFQTQLHRYTRQEDIAVGTPIANRSREELEGLIGFFVNTQVMRTNLGGNPGFRELLGRVREVALGAYAHQNVPFEKLVEELKPERDPGRNPLFQVMMVLQNAADSALKMPGLTIEHSLGDIGTAKFDLMLELEESAEGITGSFEYNTDLFDEATVERMIGHFQTLLEGIVANPDGQITGLPLLTDAERHQLLVEWNNTKTDYPKEACVHHLFEAQVERTPDAAAIVFEGQELTYRELNARANQLANHLKKRGVGPDVLVGICVERSIEMIVGLLGILKAGGAYVPLDAEYPRERLQFMVRDTGIKILLLQRRMLESFPVAVAELVCLDTDWPKISSESAQNPIGGSKSTNLAYVMYTSGSTGIPKGVEIPHQGIVRLVMNTGYAGFNSNERYLQLATIAFDASTFELWAPLLHGACCVLYPLEIPGSGRLGEVIRQHRISTLWLTASLFNMVINEAPKTLRGLSQLLIGGEQLSPSHVHRAQKELDGTQIINGYGPTESTTFTCCYAIPEGLASDAILPIGRPIANTRVYILDNNLEPLPIGIPGELHIGGDGLARGYLNRQELTSEKFISDPFSAEPNARLYKTGDLVRYRFDGNIEFLGRIDQQVKIRGFRIELGEIEAVLCLHPGIDQAAVVAQEDALKDKRLIAYVVPKTRDAEPISQSELRQFLKQKLPEYMIPSIFVTLDAMKLTSSGKVDRQALPAPDRARPDLEESYVSPHTNIEETLAAIWQEVLGMERIGIHDSFFDLGGHSLRAIQVISQIKRAFHIDLPLRRLFEAPTVATLAGHIQNALSKSHPKQSSTESSLIPIRKTGANPPIFIIHGLNGNVRLAHQMASYLGANQPVYGFYCKDGRPVSEREASLEDLAASYIEELVSLQPKGPYYLAGYSFGGFLAYEMARQLQNRGLQVEHLAIIDTGPLAQGKFSFEECLLSALSFLKNIPWWIWEDFLDEDPGAILKRIYRKVRKMRKWSKNKAKFEQKDLAVADLEDLFELSVIPKELVQTLDHHLKLVQKYQPGVYSGPLTLYKARTRPLFRFSKMDLGWSTLVTKNIEIIKIPGCHESIRKEPRVRYLAEALGAALEKIGRS